MPVKLLLLAARPAIRTLILRTRSPLHSTRVQQLSNTGIHGHNMYRYTFSSTQLALDRAHARASSTYTSTSGGDSDADAVQEWFQALNDAAVAEAEACSIVAQATGRKAAADAKRAAAKADIARQNVIRAAADGISQEKR